jgi:N-terminal acetyltransferase B complex catalytic subunit
VSSRASTARLRATVRLSSTPAPYRIERHRGGKGEGTTDRLTGAAVLGKLEASPFPPPREPYSPDTNTDPNYLPWHGHITALTIAPSARRLGHATRLSEALEKASDANDAWFVDLFVRKSNEIAKELYRKLGYSVYRVVADYYNDGEDAFDMRKPCSRDVGHKHIREDGEKHKVRPEDVW